MHPAVNPSPPTTHQPPPPQDENQKVKTITALSLAALAEASSPYGIESFDDVLEPLWKGIRSLRGKVGTARWFILGQFVFVCMGCRGHPATRCASRSLGGRSVPGPSTHPPTPPPFFPNSRLEQASHPQPTPPQPHPHPPPPNRSWPLT